VQLGKKNIWKNTTHLTVFNNKVFSIEATNKLFETTLKNGKYKEIVISKDNINLNPTANYFLCNTAGCYGGFINNTTNNKVNNLHNSNCNCNLIFSINNNLINSKNVKNNGMNSNGVCCSGAKAIGSNSNKNAASALCGIVEAGSYENKENLQLNNINTLNNINNVKRVKFLDKLNGNGNGNSTNANANNINNSISNSAANKNSVNSANKNNSSNNNSNNNINNHCNNILQRPAEIAASATSNHNNNNNMNSHSCTSATLGNVSGGGIQSGNYNHEAAHLPGAAANGLIGANMHAHNYLSSDDYETKIFKNVNMLFSTKKLIFFSNKSGEMFSYNDKNKEIKLVKTNFYKSIESYSANSTHVYFFEKNSKTIYRMDIAYSEKEKEKDFEDELCGANSKCKCKCARVHKTQKDCGFGCLRNPILDLDVKEFSENIVSEQHINCVNISKGISNCNMASCSSHSGNVITNVIGNVHGKTASKDSKIGSSSSGIINNNKNLRNNNSNSSNKDSEKKSNSNNSKRSSINNINNNITKAKNLINPNTNKEFVENFDKMEINTKISSDLKCQQQPINKASNNKNSEAAKTKSSKGTLNLENSNFPLNNNEINDNNNNNVNRVSNIYNNYYINDNIDSDIIQSDDEGNELYIEITNQNFLSCEEFFNLESINKDLTPIKIIASNTSVVIIDKIGEIYTIDICSKSNKCFQCLFMLRNCHLSNSSIIGDGDLLLLDPIRLSLNKLNILAGTEVIVLHSSKFLYTIKNIFSASSRIYFIDVSGNLYYFNEVDKKLTQIGNNGICKYILDLAVHKNFLLTIENNTLYRTSLADGNYIEMKNEYVKNYEYFFADNTNIIFISKDDDVHILNFGSPNIFNQANDRQNSTKQVKSIMNNINSLDSVDQVNLQTVTNSSNNNGNSNSTAIRANVGSVSISQPVSSMNVNGKINGNNNQLYLKSSFKYENISRMHAVTYFRNNIVFYDIKTGSIESVNIEDKSHKVMARALKNL